MLRVASTVLPVEGWGRLEVTEADMSFDEPGEPKTRPRSVPIPPILVTMLSEWAERNHLTAPDEPLFRTRNNTRPSGSNWNRAWHRAVESVGQKPLRVYDCRHAAATTWLRDFADHRRYQRIDCSPLTSAGCRSGIPTHAGSRSCVEGTQQVSPGGAAAATSRGPRER
jgi:hypothetical protein